MIASSPMGERQLVGGAMIFTDCSALCSRSTSAGERFEGRCRGLDVGEPRDLGHDLVGDAGEVALERRGEVARWRVLQHAHQHPQLDAVGMRLDLLRLVGQLVRRPAA